MRCKDMRDLLSAYLDDELRPHLRAKLESHLQSCQNCQQALARLRRLAFLLENTWAPPLPEGFANRVMTQARERVTRRQHQVGTRSGGIHWWMSMSIPMRAATAAVLIVGAAAGLLMAWDTWQDSATRPAASVTTAQSDPAALYNLDYLADAPVGSLAQVYLTLASAPNGQGD